MKVSIITATFNSAKTISDCMESVVKQDYFNIEYLIIDGGSTDGTIDIVRDFVGKYTFIRYVSEPDKGIYDALNKGVAMATGEVIGFVHSDDLLAQRDVISMVVASFEELKVDGCYGDLKYVRFSDVKKVVRHWVSKPFNDDLLRKGWMPAHPTLYLKSEVYRKQGGFNTEYRIAADYDFILRVFKVKGYKFYYLPKILYVMRTGGASNKNLKSIFKKTQEDLRALKTNQIGVPLLVVLIKNISKIPQWFYKN